MNAIILTMGKGERMRPWSLFCNKVLFKVNGQPLLKRHIEMLKERGVTSIVVIAQKSVKEIKELARQEKEIKVSVWEQQSLSDGSGGCCRKVMDEYKYDKAIIVYGDTYFEESSYNEIVDCYKKKNNYILVEPSFDNKGIIAYNKSNYHVSYVDEKGEKERVSDGVTDYGRNTGLMVLSRDVLWRKAGDLMKDVLPPRAKNLFVKIARSPGIDVGILNNYIRLIIRNSLPGEEIFKTEQIYCIVKEVIEGLVYNDT
ncbi:MAG: NDP-sugar synthase [Planctomycetota bacterium]|nr:NDP-sugar synthase [Planctomycetota bacterium]